MAFTEDRVTYGDVEFKFRKLLAPEARNVLELLRVGLKDGIDGGIGENASDMAVAYRLLLGVGGDTINDVQAALFREVWFTSPAVPSTTRLAGMEATAFKDLEAAHIYLVLAQAAVVNFRASVDVFRSLLPAKGPDSSPPEPETSTPSSPTP